MSINDVAIMLLWTCVGLVAWITVAAAVSFIIAQVCRNRERYEPRPDSYSIRTR